MERIAFLATNIFISSGEILFSKNFLKNFLIKVKFLILGIFFKEFFENWSILRNRGDDEDDKAWKLTKFWKCERHQNIIYYKNIIFYKIIIKY